MALIRKDDIYILDVRAKNHPNGLDCIQNSTHSPLLTLLDNIDKLPKNKPIIISDWAMRQAPIAAKYLQANGYNIIGVIKGGLERWQAEDLPCKSKSHILSNSSTLP